MIIHKPDAKTPLFLFRVDVTNLKKDRVEVLPNKYTKTGLSKESLAQAVRTATPPYTENWVPVEITSYQRNNNGKSLLLVHTCVFILMSQQ